MKRPVTQNIGQVHRLPRRFPVLRVNMPVGFSEPTRLASCASRDAKAWTLLLSIAFAAIGCDKHGPTPAGNEAPSIQSIEVSPLVAAPGSKATVAINVVDTDNDSLDIRCVPSGGTVGGKGRLREWRLPDTEGTYFVNVYVSDGRGGNASGIGSVRVPVSGCPQIASFTPSALFVVGGQTVQLSVAAIEPEGQALNYAYDPSAGSILGSGADVRWQAPMRPGSYRIGVRVSDGECQDTADTTITVLPPPPQLGAGETLLHWYYVDCLMQGDPQGDPHVYGELPGLVTGREILRIDRAYVRSDGEAELIEPGAVGLHLYWPPGHKKSMKLYGVNDEGVEADGTPKLEWQDYEGVVYSNYCVLSVDGLADSAHVKILLQEGDEGNSDPDDIFVTRVRVGDLRKPGHMRIESDPIREAAATLWISLMPSYPLPDGTCATGGACIPTEVLHYPSTGSNRGGHYFRDPGIADREMSDKVLVGLRVSAGARIDAIQPIFRVVRTDGTLGAFVNGDRHGGGGGDTIFTPLMSPDGFVVTGLELRIGDRVDQLALVSREWLGAGRLGGQRIVSDRLGGTGGTPQRQELIRAAVGVHGRAGAEIDAIGLLQASQ